jgi:hypothetical protein
MLECMKILESGEDHKTMPQNAIIGVEKPR